jgi:hypothetical protein
MLIDDHSRAATAAAVAGAAAALAYGALKAVWAVGGTLGVRHTPPWVDGMPGWQHFLAFWGTVALAVLAAAILLALVRPWGRAVPRRPLRAVAWLGAALMTSVGTLGSMPMVAYHLGLRDLSADEISGALAPGVYTFVYGSFLVLGVAFAATAWLTRARVRGT